VKSTEGSVRSKRLRDLPVYLFEDLAARRRQKEAEGVDVIDLSIGDPDLGAPRSVVDALAMHAADRRLHGYTPYWAIKSFNEAVAGWMARRFEVELDPTKEILPLIGTKEGIAHLPLAVVDPGDTALVPDPGYPVYSRGVWFAGGKVVWMPLVRENAFLPALESMDGQAARLIYLNYPNNPTSAVADIGFYRRMIDFAKRSGAFVVNDAAYSEITFGGYSSPSILQVSGARDVAAEFHSFSKTFSMAGWRVGFVAGCEEMVGALGALKSNIDSGVFGAVLLAAARGLSDGWPEQAQVLQEYETRRTLILEALETCDIAYHESPASLYVWARVPGDDSSLGFAGMLLDRAGVLVAPGVGFGDGGEGYFRISVTCPTDRVRTATERLREVSSHWMS
jgi:LL-diaminopimelate aminotransferase